jgi:hypothetical protein
LDHRPHRTWGADRAGGRNPLTNLTWAAGQAIAASAGGALAEATSDAVPYLLLGAACLATLCATLRPRPLSTR